VDVVVVNQNARVHVFENRIGDGRAWVSFQVLERGDVDALGARLRLFTGGRVQVRDVHRAYGYQASHDPRQVFGLGSSARVEEVEVRWNDGATETFGPFMPGALHVLRRGQGR
jgi:hypothetical protein